MVGMTTGSLAAVTVASTAPAIGPHGKFAGDRSFCVVERGLEPLDLVEVSPPRT